MIIYSMTATFGKLENETLTLEPGLNIITAPNEWGKSTWCAFVVAMFYGLETRSHTTKTVIADKERYAPWSGSPMSGSICLHWRGKDITIQRRTKGRVPMGEFSAFETQSGLPVPELTAGNCGQLLLGVEKSVFLRCAFLRGSELVVTQDENLRRRLNALVTTGDDSGTADELEKKLKELKNQCRSNRVTGLLPQALARKAKLLETMDALQQLEARHQQLLMQEQALLQRQSDLTNHRQALEYSAEHETRQQLALAQGLLEEAAQRESLLAEQCAAIPSLPTVEQELRSMQTLQAQQEALQAQLLNLPAESGESVNYSSAREDARHYYRYKNLQVFLDILSVMAICDCIGLLLFSDYYLWGILLGVAGVLFQIFSLIPGGRKHRLLRKYEPVPPDQWVVLSWEQEQNRMHRHSLEELLSQHRQDLQERTGGLSAEEYGIQLNQYRELHNSLAEAHQEYLRAVQLTSALQAACRNAAPPSKQDRLTASMEETLDALTACSNQLHLLQLQIGACRGQMTGLGDAALLQRELDAVNLRITALEDHYAALEIAQSALEEATVQLQRRFAPKIAKRAQTLFGSMTQGRYQRLVLDSELQVSVSAEGETTLRPSLWRSEGTVDQLYLALRLAVAEELTPQAPLILDDALVRFDDERLAKTVSVLRKESEIKQILLFTCSSREQQA